AVNPRYVGCTLNFALESGVAACEPQSSGYFSRFRRNRLPRSPHSLHSSARYEMASRREEADFLYEAAARLRLLAPKCAAPIREELIQFAREIHRRAEEISSGRD